MFPSYWEAENISLKHSFAFTKDIFLWSCCWHRAATGRPVASFDWRQHRATFVCTLHRELGRFFKKWAIPAVFFLYFCRLNTVDSKQIFNKICQWLDSNRRPLVLEATALPTEPLQLPKLSRFWKAKNIPLKYTKRHTKGWFRLVAGRSRIAVDCSKAEIGYFLSLCRNATDYCRLQQICNIEWTRLNCQCQLGREYL